MRPRPCLIGLDEPEIGELRKRTAVEFLACETLPRMFVRDGGLFVESPRSSRFLPISAVVFHGIFADDHDWIGGLALWGGPCFPAAAAMLDCRLKLPCLVRALKFTHFGGQRGFATAGISYPTRTERVAKWGDWHCGENKTRIHDGDEILQPSIVEPYFPGTAVRVVVIGPHVRQILLAGNDWLKSIHHAAAHFVEPDPRLVEDTRRIAAGFGLVVAANDYIVEPDGTPHLLEVNHIPNVTRFPELWELYAGEVTQWLEEIDGGE